jgi:hypothetical protein
MTLNPLGKDHHPPPHVFGGGVEVIAKADRRAYFAIVAAQPLILSRRR